MKKLNEKKNENYDFVLKQKIVEAIIFSSPDPVPYDELLKRIIDKNILNEILENLEKKYSSSGVNLYVINELSQNGGQSHRIDVGSNFICGDSCS